METEENYEEEKNKIRLKFKNDIQEAIAKTNEGKLSGFEVLALIEALSDMLFGCYLTMNQMGMPEQNVNRLSQNLTIAVAEALSEKRTIN